MSKPYRDLTRVKALIDEAAIGGRVIAKTKEAYPGDTREVERFIRYTIRRLDANAFVKPELQTYDTKSIMADIYAFTDPGGDGWFVKFYIDGERLVVVSCHHCEEGRPELVRADGKVVRARKK